MSAFNRSALAASPPLTGRPLALAGGFALAAAVAFLVRHVAPEAPARVAIGLSILAGLAAVALALTLEEDAMPGLTRGVLGGAALAALGALPVAQIRLRLFSLAMAALMAALAFWLARAGPRRLRVSPGSAWLAAATLAALCAYAAIIVIASRDLMIADFMTCRNIAIMVARLADAGHWPLLLFATVESIAQDYSWAPALVPGLALALTAPFSRAVYTFAILALYAAPAALALSVLARDLARRARPSPQPSPANGRGGVPSPAKPVERRASLDALSGRRRPSGSDEGALSLPLGLAAVVAAYPAGMAVAARGMPDVGGLILVVVALRLAERLARLLALPRGHDARVAPMTRRVAVALALTFFAMFAFRRWYAFAAVGIAAMLGVEVALVAFARGRGFGWKEAIAAGALGGLTLLALASPVVVAWLPNLSAHDYGSAYAAYRKPPDVFLRQLGDWVGLLPALAALAGAAFLWLRSADRRLLRLTLGGATVAAFLFLRVQTPYIHHLYLIAPAIVAPVAGALMIAFARAPRVALAALAGLCLLTLSPLAYALNPAGLTPVAGLPRAPRADLAELERMKDWVDARARPDARICGLGSSYTFSGQLIGELWQLHPERRTLAAAPGTDVTMSDVDTVEGPPAAGLKDCAYLIVGDPVQTHLDPDYQQTVIVPSREVLGGQGIGAKFRRAGEVFHLEKGVSAIVMERIAPIDDSDIAALQARWRASRAALGFFGRR
jgi:hypothetical protein